MATTCPSSGTSFAKLTPTVRSPSELVGMCYEERMPLRSLSARRSTTTRGVSQTVSLSVLRSSGRFIHSHQTEAVAKLKQSPVVPVSRIARHRDAPLGGTVASSAVVVVVVLGVLSVAPGLVNTASTPTETTSVAIDGSVGRCERDGMGLRAVNNLRFVSLCKLTKDASRIFLYRRYA